MSEMIEGDVMAGYANYYYNRIWFADTSRTKERWIDNFMRAANPALTIALWSDVVETTEVLWRDVWMFERPYAWVAKLVILHALGDYTAHRKMEATDLEMEFVRTTFAEVRCRYGPMCQCRR